MTTSIQLRDVPRFDAGDFARRWEAARLSALPSLADGTESERIGKVREDERDAVLRKVFDASRKIGRSASRHFGVSFEHPDLVELLQEAKIPCFLGAWENRASASVLRRKGCDSLAAWGSFGCDYWREALDGLVMGACEDERLSRHQSAGHGDAECVDVLFAEHPSWKYGPLPETLREGLQEVRELFASMRIELRLEGVSEGVLYYELHPEKGVLCGAGGKLMHETFHKALRERFPTLRAQDSSPLAVYGGAT